MPLPDERPRQSVANLIGRFEQKTKRQSFTGTPPAPLLPSGPHIPRNSSALSSNGSDAAKIEEKEKREWPPKSKEPSNSPPSVTASLSPDPPKLDLPNPASKSPSPTTEPSIVPDPIEVVEATPIDETPPPPPPLAEEPTPAPEPEVKSPKSEPVRTPEPPVSPVLAPAVPAAAAVATTTTAKPGIPKSVPSTPSRNRVAPSKPTPAAKGTPAKQYHHSALSTPPTQTRSSASTHNARLTATTTAPSAAAGAARPRPSSSASNRPPPPPIPKVPSTPSRAKTPTSTRPKTPSIRPKTPSSAAPKPPPTGLFAPTAASLARSRNIPSPVPTPARRQSLGPEVAERLFKPTASSASKVRQPTLLNTPGKPTAAGGITKSVSAAAGKGGPVPTALKGVLKTSVSSGGKARVSPVASGTKMKAQAGNGGVAAGATGAGSATGTISPPAGVHSEPEDTSFEVRDSDDGAEESAHHDEDVEDHHEDERQREGSATTSSTLVHDEPEEHDHQVILGKADVEINVHDDEESHHHHNESAEQSVSEGHHESPTEEPHQEEVLKNGFGSAGAQDDLDHIVNMLEAKPLISNVIVSPAAPEGVDIDEIPDIDD